jgi:hypothetical protein
MFAGDGNGNKHQAIEEETFVTMCENVLNVGCKFPSAWDCITHLDHPSTFGFISLCDLKLRSSTTQNFTRFNVFRSLECCTQLTMML